jgi:FKBP-type peptidyl-prolyl cis-trans isomerase
LEEGSGRTPTEKDRVKVHYRAMRYDGTEIDSSYKREEPREFAVARLFPGWKEALQLMQEGDKWELFIPADLAYGERGRPPRIAPNTALMFEMELIEVIEQEAETETTETQQESG